MDTAIAGGVRRSSTDITTRNARVLVNPTRSPVATTSTAKQAPPTSRSAATTSGASTCSASVCVTTSAIASSPRAAVTQYRTGVSSPGNEPANSELAGGPQQQRVLSLPGQSSLDLDDRQSSFGQDPGRLYSTESNARPQRPNREKYVSLAYKQTTPIANAHATHTAGASDARKQAHHDSRHGTVTSSIPSTGEQANDTKISVADRVKSFSIQGSSSDSSKRLVYI